MKFFKNKKGFTLVELVVVIAILGILAGIAIPRFMDATATAKGSKIVADMRTIDSAIMMYNAQKGSLPANVTAAAAGDTQLTGANLLASWPVPPTGEAKIVNNSGASVSIQSSTDSAVYYGITDGRAMFRSKNVDAILTTPATTTTTTTP